MFGKSFGYGDWVVIKPLKEAMQHNGEIYIRGRSGIAHQEILDKCSGKLVRLLDTFYTGSEELFETSRLEHARLSKDVIQKVDVLAAHKELEKQDIKIGDIIEGNVLSNLFYNLTNAAMKRAVVWKMEGSGMSLFIYDHEKYPKDYRTATSLGNVYGDLAAAYNVFDVVGHTDLITLKVHCDYVPPRYRSKKYACYGSLGAFLDNFNVTMAELKESIGYCPVARLFETENIEEFEKAVNENTSLRIKIVR